MARSNLHPVSEHFFLSMGGSSFAQGRGFAEADSPTCRPLTQFLPPLSSVRSL